MSIGKRIKELRKGKLNQIQLARLVHVSIDTIRRWESDKRAPRSIDIQVLAEILNTTAAYLLGETDDSAPKPVSSEISHDENKNINEPYKLGVVSDITSQFMMIPVVELEACAGNGNGYAEFEWKETGRIPVNKTELLGHIWRSENMRIIRINGKSMEPKYYDGDQVLFVQGEEYFPSDIVIAVFDGRIYIRGYFPEEGQIRLKPLNPIAMDIVVPIGDQRLSIAGKVIAKVPKLEMDGGFYS